MLSLSFVAGTLVGVPYDQWMGIDIGGFEYRCWVGGGYWIGAPVMLVSTYWLVRLGPLDYGELWLGVTSVGLWIGWGLVSLMAKWAKAAGPRYRWLNVPTCAAVGFVVGLAAIGATTSALTKLREVQQPGFEPLLDIPMIAVLLALLALCIIGLWRDCSALRARTQRTSKMGEAARVEALQSALRSLAEARARVEEAADAVTGDYLRLGKGLDDLNERKPLELAQDDGLSSPSAPADKA